MLQPSPTFCSGSGSTTAAFELPMRHSYNQKNKQLRKPGSVYNSWVRVEPKFNTGVKSGRAPFLHLLHPVFPQKGNIGEQPMCTTRLRDLLYSYKEDWTEHNVHLYYNMARLTSYQLPHPALFSSEHQNLDICHVTITAFFPAVMILQNRL